MEHDFADSSWMPGAETREALIAAAMAHLDASGAASFLTPVPGTDPPLFIALGTLPALLMAVAAKSARVDPSDA